MRAQHLGKGAGLARDLAAIAGIAAVEVGEAAHADRMVIAAGQQGRPRRRAHGGGVEAGVAQALRPATINSRRRDRRAVAAEIGEADVVEQNDQNIRRAGRRLAAGGQCGDDSAMVRPILPMNGCLLPVMCPCPRKAWSTRV